MAIGKILLDTHQSVFLLLVKSQSLTSLRRLVVIGHYWRRFLDEVHPKVFEKHPCRSSIHQDGQLDFVRSDSGFLQIKRLADNPCILFIFLPGLFWLPDCFVCWFQKPVPWPIYLRSDVQEGLLAIWRCCQAELTLAYACFCNGWLMEFNPGSLNKKHTPNLDDFIELTMETSNL